MQLVQRISSSIYGVVGTLSWLEPIKNVWGILARAVYAGNKHFTTTKDLIEYIDNAWESMGEEVIEKLVRSMHKHTVDVLTRQGRHIDYWNVRDWLLLHLGSN